MNQDDESQGGGGADVGVDQEPEESQGMEEQMSELMRNLNWVRSITVRLGGWRSGWGWGTGASGLASFGKSGESARATWTGWSWLATGWLAGWLVAGTGWLDTCRLVFTRLRGIYDGATYLVKPSCCFYRLHNEPAKQPDL